MYKHGYILVRIMHGQIDFEKPDAEKALLQMLKKAGVFEMSKHETTNAVNLKIAMYLQTDQ